MNGAETDNKEHIMFRRILPKGRVGNGIAQSNFWVKLESVRSTDILKVHSRRLAVSTNSRPQCQRNGLSNLHPDKGRGFAEAVKGFDPSVKPYQGTNRDTHL